MRIITAVGAALAAAVLAWPAAQAASVLTVPQEWERQYMTNWAPVTEAFSRIEESDAKRVLAQLLPEGASVTAVAPGAAGNEELLLRDYGTADYPLYVSGLVDEYIAEGFFPPLERVSVPERQRIIRAARAVRLTQAGHTTGALLLAVPKRVLGAERMLGTATDDGARVLTAEEREKLGARLTERVRQTIEREQAVAFRLLMTVAHRVGGLTIKRTDDRAVTDAHVEVAAWERSARRPAGDTATTMTQTAVVRETQPGSHDVVVQMHTRVLTEQDTIWVLWTVTKMDTTEGGIR